MVSDQSHGPTEPMPTGKISALKAQANDPQRVNVFIDDEFALGVSLTTLTSEGLFVGKAIDEETWERLAESEQRDKALRAAVRLIEYRPRTHTELHDRLKRKGYPEPAIEAALTRLHEIDLIDDAAFSEMYVASRSNTNRSTRALRNELRRKGVAQPTIEEVLAEYDNTEAEHERAESVARNALKRYANAPDRLTFQRRLGGFLQRRGFDYETIGPIMQRLWEELEAERGDEAES